VTNVLRENLGDATEVESFKFLECTLPGENITSELVKLDVKKKSADDQEWSCIVKLWPGDMKTSSVTRTIRNAFKKENIFYGKILPLLNDQLRIIEYPLLNVPKRFRFSYER